MAVVGWIARAHGIRGQVIVNPETDFAQDRFQPGATLFTRPQGGANGERGRIKVLTVSTVRFQHERPVIAFEGVENMDAAIELAGAELRVPIDQLRPLPDGAFYRHDLVGCRVEKRTGEQVGVVAGVEGTLTGSRLVVDVDGEELLVPLVDAICPIIDPAVKRIVIDPPEGLLELNAIYNSKLGIRNSSRIRNSSSTRKS